MSAPTQPAAVAINQTIAIDLLIPSPTNPRKRFDDAKLKELADSIRTQGVLQPLLVRQTTLKFKKPETWPFKQQQLYEIIAGERRYRAAKLAGLAELPCFVRELTDLQVLHAQVIENLQRDDLHPLEEAEGYQRLIELGSKAEDLGTEIGKSRAYIYGRLKLCALVAEARAAFYDGLLDASTALLIARIPVGKLQVQATKKITVVNQYTNRAMSFREARDLLQREYMTDLDDAPFPIKDAKLLDKVGSCVDCIKRTGNQPELFDDVNSKDVCTDTVCFAMKKTAHILALQKEAEAKGHQVIKGKEAHKIMPHGYPERESGLVKLDSAVPGDEKGRTWQQVLGKKALETAKGAEKPLVQTTLVEHPRSGELVPTINVEQAVKALREMGIEVKPAKSTQVWDRGPSDAEINARLEQAQAYRSQLFDALHGKVEADMRNLKPHVADGLYRILAEQVLEYLVQGYDHVARLAKRYFPEIDLEDYDEDKVADDFNAFVKKATVQQQFMIIIDSLMIQELTTNRWNIENSKPDVMLDIAGELGIDAAAIEKKAVEEVKAAQKAAAADSTKKAKPAKAGK